MANLPGVLVGITVTMFSFISTLIALYYYLSIKGHLVKKIAIVTIISTLLSLTGGIAVIIDSLSSKNLWWTMAALFPVSYSLLVVSSLYYLHLAGKYLSPGGTIKGDIPSQTTPSISKSKEENERAKKLRPFIGGFSIGPDQLSQLTPACRLFNGVIYIGRKTDSINCEGLEKRLWLSRLGTKNAVDPSKLHVILQETIQFLSEKGGGCLVLLDNIEYLLLHNDFKGVMKFLASLKDYVIMSNSTLIVIVDMEVLEDREYSVLLREFPPLDIEKLLSSVEEKALFGVLSKDLSKKQGEKRVKEDEETQEKSMEEQEKESEN